MNEPQTPREWLLLALEDFGIAIEQDRDNFIDIEKEYAIEIEKNGIYKLLWKGKVVAPFADLAELCNFIKMS